MFSRYVALMALPFALAQSSMTTVSTDGSLPACVPLCMSTKFSEASSLAPACNVNDLFCLCTTSRFVTAYRSCLYDNCASTNESTIGRQTLAEICSDVGAALLTYTAKHDQAAASTAVQEVASVLAMTGSGAPLPTAGFDTASAEAYIASNYAAQEAYATSSVAAQLSQDAALASASIRNEAAAISQSYQAAVAQATQIGYALETQLSGSALQAAQSQITATLSMMKVQASLKLESAIQAAQASLSSESNALYSVVATATASPSAQVQAVSSSGMKMQLSFALGSLASVGLAVFAFL